MGFPATASVNASTPRCSTCPHREHSLFADFCPAGLRRLDAAKGVRFFKKGDVLFNEGDPCQGLYCVFSGAIKTSKTGDSGREQIEGICRPGDPIGHRGLFYQGRHHRTATMMEEGQVCVISKPTFSDLLKDIPPLSSNLINRLAREVCDLEDRLLTLVDKPADVRLAQLLISLSSEGLGSSRMGVRLSRLEMGELIGTTVETVIRILSRFKRQGWVDFDGKDTLLTNRPAIEKFAKSPS